MDQNAKSEFPLSEVVKVEFKPLKKGTDDKRVNILFKQKGRVYHIEFVDHKGAEDFCNRVNDVICPGPLGASLPPADTSAQRRAPLVSGRLASTSISLSIRDRLPSVAVGKSGAKEYLDFHVVKKNKYHMNQRRVLVINEKDRSILLLDDKRKVKKKYLVSDIMQLEVVPPDEAKHDDKLGPQVFIVFRKETSQRPFNIFFPDAVGLLHFCEHLQSIQPSIEIKDETDTSLSNEGQRFIVLKQNKLGVRKKRIIALLFRNRVLRSFDAEKKFKDFHFDKVVRLEKSWEDRCRLHVYRKEHSTPFVFIFTEPAARERFYVLAFKLFPPILARRYISVPGGADKVETKKLEKPPEQVTIFTGTWNLGNAPPSGADLTPDRKSVV